MALFEDLATHLACQGELTRMNLQKGGKIQVTTLERRRRRGFQVERGMAAPLAVENKQPGADACLAVRATRGCRLVLDS